MNHKDIINALSIIRPNAEFVLRGGEIEWFDESEKPTIQEIEQGFEMYLIAKTEAESEAQAKRQALLDRLGITEEEARLLLGGNN